jgi:type I restriction enzyme S subunit
MASKWPQVSLDAIYEFSSGLSKPRSEFGFGYGFVSFKDVLDNYFIPDTLTALVNSSEKERFGCSVKRGDVFLTRTSETYEDLGMSSVALKDYPDATFNGFTKRLRPKGKADVFPEYAAYAFRGRAFRVAVTAMSSLSTRASLNNEMLQRLSIPLPPIEIQKRIAHILKSFDDKIELNRRMNATLEAMARALFQSWFVDFDPVRAKLDGRQSTGKVNPVSSKFPSEFDHMAGNVSPRGWQRKRWGDIATLEYGKSLRDYAASNGAYRVYGTNGPIGFHDNPLCNSDGIVIGRKGAYRGVHYSPEPFFVIDTAFYLKPTAQIDLKWAYYELLRFDINSMDSGSAIPSTSRDDFYGIPVVVPPPEIQCGFGEIVSDWFSQMQSNDSQSQALAKLRDTLLPRLLSGQITLDGRPETI